MTYSIRNSPRKASSHGNPTVTYDGDILPYFSWKVNTLLNFEPLLKEAKTATRKYRLRKAHHPQSR